MIVCQFYSVSGNWQITFEEESGHIDGLNLEDYHC